MHHPFGSSVCRMNRNYSLSLENHTNLLSCPIFIASCKDDPTVDYRNSLLLDSALTKNNIPHIFHLYEEGGHGFGISNEKGSTQSRTWKQSLLYVSCLQLTSCCVYFATSFKQHSQNTNKENTVGSHPKFLLM